MVVARIDDYGSERNDILRGNGRFDKASSGYEMGFKKSVRFLNRNMFMRNDWKRMSRRVNWRSWRVN